MGDSTGWEAESARMRGNEHFKRKRYAEAIAAYTESLRLLPEQAVVYANRGASHIKLSAWPAAEADCSAAIHLDPTHVKAHTRRARARVEQGKWHAALEDVEAAVRLDESQRGVLAELVQRAEAGLQQEQQHGKQPIEAGPKPAAPSGAAAESSSTQAHQVLEADEGVATPEGSALLQAARRISREQAAMRPPGLQPVISEEEAAPEEAASEEAVGASAAAAAAVSDDEDVQPEPEAPWAQAQRQARKVLEQEHTQPGLGAEAAAAWMRQLSDAISSCPGMPELYEARSKANVTVIRLQQAIADATTALELRREAAPGLAASDAAPPAADNSLLRLRATSRQAIGDLQGALEDLKAAMDGPVGEAAMAEIQRRRAQLVQMLLSQRKQEQKRQQEEHVYTYHRGTTIQELTESEGDVAAGSAQRAIEQGQTEAARARSLVARMQREHEQAVREVRHQNEGRRERNAVREARRCQAAEAAAAAAEERQQARLLRERTRIPVAEEEDEDEQPQQPQQSHVVPMHAATAPASSQRPGDTTDAEAAAPAAAQQPPKASQQPMDAELDRLKEEADRLQLARNYAEAEAKYRSYLEHRPADLRVWSNLAQVLTSACRHQEALDACDAADRAAAHAAEFGQQQQLAALPAHKLLVRRASALAGLGQLQDALATWEQAQARAEAAGDTSACINIAKRQRDLLEQIEAQQRRSASSGDAASGEALPPRPDSSLGAATSAMAASAPPRKVSSASSPASSSAVPASQQDGQAVGDEDVAAARARMQKEKEAEMAAKQLRMAQEALEKGRQCAKHQPPLWGRAADEFEEAGGLNPQCKEAWANLALAKMHIVPVAWREVEDAASKALLVDPGMTRARYRRGVALREQNKLEAAAEDLQRALKEEPTDAAIQNEWRRVREEAARRGLRLTA